MSETLSLILAAIATLAGMAWLALGMETHWEQVRGKDHALTRRRQVVLRALGAAGLLLSLLLCLKADHASMAVLVWTMLLAGSAIGVAMVLTWYPRGLGALAGPRA